VLFFFQERNNCFIPFPAPEKGIESENKESLLSISMIESTTFGELNENENMKRAMSDKLIQKHDPEYSGWRVPSGN